MLAPEFANFAQQFRVTTLLLPHQQQQQQQPSHPPPSTGAAATCLRPAQGPTLFGTLASSRGRDLLQPSPITPALWQRALGIVSLS